MTKVLEFTGAVPVERPVVQAARTRVVRYGIANLDPVAAAMIISGLGVAASITAGLGTGPWGTEPTTFIEVATDNVRKMDNYVIGILLALGETAAYRTVDGKDASLIYSNRGVYEKSIEAL